MNHIVIDYQQRQRYIVIFVASIIFSFVLGLWFGYHSVSTKIITSDTLHDGSPYNSENPPAMQGSGDNTVPAVARPVANSKPLAKPESKPSSTVNAPAAPAVLKPSAVTAPVAPPIKPVINKPVVNKPIVVEPVLPAPVDVPVEAPDGVTTSEPMTHNSLSTGATNAQYTVQAGVFESRDNAMKLVAELGTKGFDAYVDEVGSHTGDTKFNVRFSRNSDRDYVQKRLARFKQLYTTSAYIIVIDP